MRRFVRILQSEITEEAKILFWDKVVKGGDDDCWEWTGYINPGGYGTFGVNRKSRLANRVAYAICKGDVSSTLCVCHTCDNRKCVNPAHLFLGTIADNNADRDRKGRFNYTYPPERKGEHSHAAKLTNADVLEIKKMLASGHVQRVIAQHFNVNQVTISRIHTGAQWSHVSLGEPVINQKGATDG